MPPKQPTSRTGSKGSQSSSTFGAPRKDATVYTGGVNDPTGKMVAYVGKDDECPICKSDRYLNPNIRLLISPCYHRMCDSCIDRLYSLGSGPCPICKTQVRKANFMIQTFEDLVVEKEVVIRRRIAKEFNKRRGDFEDLKSYNDYLEEVEDIAFNLINDIDIPQTEARLTKLRNENAAYTALNTQRDARDAMAVQAEEERIWREQQERAKEARLEEEEERMEREREKKAIINSLETSNVPAVKLIAKKKREATKRDQDSTRSRISRHPSGNLNSSQSSTGSSSQVWPPSPFRPITDSYYSHADRFILSLSAPPGTQPLSNIMTATGGGNYGDPGTDGVLRGLGVDVLRAGGYRLADVQERAVRSSVCGLSVGLVLRD